jgi:hypothetical protein
LAGGDVLKVPFNALVTNFTFGGNTSGYTGDVIGLGKLYLSTLEYNGSTTAYKLYSYNTVPTTQGTAVGGVYETQQQLFSKRKKATEVRVYLEPAVAGNAFQIDLVGIDGQVITDTTKTFSVAGSTMNVGDTVVWYNPGTMQTAALGLRVTNTGSVTPVIHKVEIDITDFGK